jgi:hypothetical protein
MGVVVRRDNGHGTAVKENKGGGWSSDGMVLWLGTKVEMTFYSNGGWEVGLSEEGGHRR